MLLTFSGSPKLKGLAVISHIVETLRDPYSCSSHGQDFCSILLKNILSTRKYVVELNSKDWHGMIYFHRQVILDCWIQVPPGMQTVRALILLPCKITTVYLSWLNQEQCGLVNIECGQNYPYTVEGP